MALQTNLESSNVGVAFPEAYARINFYRGDKRNVQIFVDFYANASAASNRAQQIKNMTFTMPFTEITGDFFPSMYTWLKQQPDFVNALDC